MPRNAAKRFATSNSIGPRFHFARLHLGEVQQIVDEFQQILGGSPDVADLLFLFGREVAIRTVDRETAERQN